MKILKLDLTAFGPFTNTGLEFGDEQNKLHIIYGPNEAGKSSALRALNALLFGIGRTTDNFLHDEKHLQLGATLALDDGSVLGLIRKKSGLKQEGGPAMTQADLSVRLKGLDRDTFINEFGIDHQVLVRGGKDLLSGKGEVGKSLFSAALGKTGLPEVLKKLEKDANDLFRKGASTGPEILKLRKEYESLKKEATSAMLSPVEWGKKKDELDELIHASEEIAEQIKEKEADRNRSVRVNRTLPKIHKRAALLAQRDGLGKVVLLSPDFSEARRQAVTQFTTGGVVFQSAEEELERLEAEASGIDVLQVLIDNEDTINDLVERSGSYRKAAKDMVARRGELKRVDDDIDAMLKGLGKGATRDTALEMQPAVASKVQILALGNKRQSLVDKVSRAEADLETSQKDLEAGRTELKEMSAAADASDLKSLVAAIQKSGDLEAFLAKLVLEKDKAREKLNIDLAKMPMWDGTAEALEKAKVPLPETVDKFETDFAQLESDKRTLAERLAEVEASIGELDLKLKELQKTGEVPDEEELEKARAKRDKGWGLVRKAWLDKEDVAVEATEFEPSSELPEAYEKSVQGADGISDRLRREADRVAANASLVVKLEELDKKKAEITEALEDTEKRIAELAAHWKDKWPAEIPELATPREMRRWQIVRDEAVKQAGTIWDLKRECEQVKASIEVHRKALFSAIEPLVERKPAEDASLINLLEVAQHAAASIEEDNRTRKSLADSIIKLEAAVARLKDEKVQASTTLENWQSEWSAAVDIIRLKKESSPDEANAVLELLSGISSKVESARELQSRLDGMAADNEVFEKDTEYVVNATIPELKSLPCEQAVSQLNIALGKAKENSVKLAGLNKQIGQKSKAVKGAEDQVKLAGIQLERLCQQAECKASDDLEKAEEASDSYKDIEKKISDIELELAEEGAGATIEELIEASKDLDADVLAADISRIETELEELQQKQINIAEDKGKAETLFNQMDGDDEAAEIEEKAQEKLAILSEKVEEYIRLRMAYMILRDEIDRYRAANEEPLLKRAGELFSKLTLDSFARLTTDYNEKDEPILIGVRPDGETVRVEGMSDGTVDQMYLSLRLAALEKRLAEVEVVPFVVDDILIRFDDDRSEATLRVLNELAEKTQVIFFTHNKGLLEAAERLFDVGSVKIHELKPGNFEATAA